MVRLGCVWVAVCCLVCSVGAVPVQNADTAKLASPAHTDNDDPDYSHVDDLEMFVGLQSGISMVTSMLQLASQPFENDAITLAIQCDLERLRAGELNRIASQWRGPISVAILANEQEPVSAYLSGNANNDVKEWADVTVAVYTKKPKYYPINKMRNYALTAVRTEYVFVLDIDEQIPFPMFEFRNELLKAKSGRPPHTIYAITSWQWAVDSPNGGVPSSFEALKSLLDQGAVTMKHPEYPAAYSIPDHDSKWWASLEKATPIKYADSYEPYFVAKKSVLPMFDERFVGYGGNKAIHTLRVALDGFHFTILPRTFSFENTTPAQYQPRKSTNRKLLEDAWWEVGKEHGCEGCSLKECVKNCANQFAANAAAQGTVSAGPDPMNITPTDNMNLAPVVTQPQS